jgi:hypothetical protein
MFKLLYTLLFVGTFTSAGGLSVAASDLAHQEPQIRDWPAAGLEGLTQSEARRLARDEIQQQLRQIDVVTAEQCWAGPFWNWELKTRSATTDVVELWVYVRGPLRDCHRYVSFDCKVVLSRQGRTGWLAGHADCEPASVSGEF